MNDLSDLIQQAKQSRRVQPRVIVRVTTESWSDHRGINETRRIRFLRRQCREHNFLEEDAHMVGARETLERIVNWRGLPDGVYQVFTTNLCSNWETGLIEEWDYRLEPFDDTTDETQ